MRHLLPGPFFTIPPVLKFTEVDSERAQKEWKASCGPHSIAAACGVTLDVVRQFLPDFKGWMSPTQMEKALTAMERPYKRTSGLKTMSLCQGINRVQWEGKWLNPGVPSRVAYFHTHWVAAFGEHVLCTACQPAEWLDHAEWRVFHLTVEPVSPFHITHHYEMERPDGR